MKKKIIVQSNRTYFMTKEEREFIIKNLDNIKFNVGETHKVYSCSCEKNKNNSDKKSYE